jgi:hypothetical protein
VTESSSVEEVITSLCDSELIVIYICDLHSVKLDLLLQMSSGVPPV